MTAAVAGRVRKWKAVLAFQGARLAPSFARAQGATALTDLRLMKLSGASTVVQDPADAAFPSMPEHGIQNAGIRALQLRRQFRYFQHGQHLAGVDMIPNIDVDLADVPRHLRVKFDFLIGNKFTGDGKAVRDISALDERDRRATVLPKVPPGPSARTRDATTNPRMRQMTIIPMAGIANFTADVHCFSSQTQVLCRGRFQL